MSSTSPVLSASSSCTLFAPRPVKAVTPTNTPAYGVQSSYSDAAFADLFAAMNVVKSQPVPIAANGRTMPTTPRRPGHVRRSSQLPSKGELADAERELSEILRSASAPPEFDDQQQFVHNIFVASPPSRALNPLSHNPSWLSSSPNSSLMVGASH